MIRANSTAQFLAICGHCVCTYMMWCSIVSLYISSWGEIYARVQALSKFSIIFRTTNPFEDSPTNDRRGKENYPLQQILPEIVFNWNWGYVQGRQSVPKSGRSEWGGERKFSVAPKNVLLKGYFYPNFRGGAEKVIVHMHWLTWLLWRHWLCMKQPCRRYITLLKLPTKICHI